MGVFVKIALGMDMMENLDCLDVEMGEVELPIKLMVVMVVPQVRGEVVPPATTHHQVRPGELVGLVEEGKFGFGVGNI